MTTDFLVIGAGVLGITIARELRRRDRGSVLVIDKEPGPARHASGRNSGVLHAGVYYKPNTRKAHFCVEGNRRLRRFCAQNGISVNTAGKVIVARSEAELPALNELHDRAAGNGVGIDWLDAGDLQKIEPSARTVSRALFVKDTAVVDPTAVTEALAADAERMGVRFRYGTHWRGFQGEHEAWTSSGRIAYGHCVNCGGLYADRIAHAVGVGGQYRILPFRGAYFRLGDQSRVQVRGNIYPVPDLREPFLGVHFTRRPDGVVTVGPSALPLIGREQYAGLRGASVRDAWATGCFLARLLVSNTEHFRSFAFREMRKLSRRGFYREASGLVRGLERQDLLPGSRPGIRAQLYNVTTGALVNDFVVEAGPSSTHLLNAVSPAFTCALPFAEHVVDNIKPGG